MKISKRILGVALALIMIFNVFAVGTFAAFPEDSAVKLSISTEDKPYAPGDEIVFTFTEQVLEEVGAMFIGGQYQIAYPTSVLDPYAESDVLENHGFVALAAGYDSGISGVSLPSKISTDINVDGATQYGWDELIQFNVGDDSTENDATAPLQLFSIKMKIADDAANGTYTIGFNYDAYEAEDAFVNDAANEGLYGTDASAWGFSVDNLYDLGTCTFTVGEAAPAEKEVKHADTMAQWADKDAGKINVGLVGKFLTNDIAIEYDGNRLTNVEKVGAKITINGTEVEGYTDYVYDVNGDGSELWFRAVVSGVDYNATGAAGDISVVYVVEMTDGTTYESIAYTTTVAEVYAEACGNGMPAFGA